jgi:acyl carrier protein
MLGTPGCALGQGKIRSMRTPDQTVDEILNLAATHFRVPREKLTPDDDFFKTLGIDSLQALDLLTRLENHFNIEVPDYELQGVSDFRTLATRIQSRL